jgi:hypothetical protein
VQCSIVSHNAMWFMCDGVTCNMICGIVDWLV